MKGRKKSDLDLETVHERFTERVAMRAGAPKSVVREVVQALVEELVKTLVLRGRVEIRWLGTFTIRHISRGYRKRLIAHPLTAALATEPVNFAAPRPLSRILDQRWTWVNDEGHARGASMVEFTSADLLRQSMDEQQQLVELNAFSKKKRRSEMKKAEMVQSIAEECGVGKDVAASMLNAFVGIVHRELQEIGKVRVHGLGLFEVKERAERKGRNPKTGDPIVITARKVVAFHLSDSITI